jgi:hypothetical protein
MRLLGTKTTKHRSNLMIAELLRAQPPSIMGLGRPKRTKRRSNLMINARPAVRGGEGRGGLALVGWVGRVAD